jgi:hypothetical protein
MQGEVSKRKCNDSLEMVRNGKNKMGEQKPGVACHIGPAITKSDMHALLAQQLLSN